MISDAIIFRTYRNVIAFPHKPGQKHDQKRHGARKIVVRRHALQRFQATLRVGNMTFRCAIGRSGTTVNKREGDGATPVTSLRPMLLLYRADRLIPGIARAPLPKLAVRKNMGWSDYPSDKRYNKPVKIPYISSHELLYRDDGLYDACIVLDWNMRPAKRARGSAIFMHIARPGYQPTEGCIALKPRDMARLLPHLTRHTHIIVSG